MVQLGKCWSSIPGAPGFNPQHYINQACNPNTKEVRPRELGVQSQPLLHSEFKTSLGYIKKGKNGRQGERERGTKGGREEGGDKE